MLPGNLVQIQKRPVKSLLPTSKPSPPVGPEPAQSTARVCPRRDLSPDLGLSLPAPRRLPRERAPPASSPSVTVSTARGLWTLKAGSGPRRSRACDKDRRAGCSSALVGELGRETEKAAAKGCMCPNEVTLEGTGLDSSEEFWKTTHIMLGNHPPRNQEEGSWGIYPPSCCSSPAEGCFQEHSPSSVFDFSPT